MKKLLVALILVLFTSLTAAYAGFDFSGYLKNETSLRINEFNGDLTKFKNIIQLAGEYQFNETLALFSKVRYWYDAMYGFRDEYDAGQYYQGHVQRTDWLRDCYLDYNNEAWFLRLGKQQVAWGQSDGIAILDRVNPFDLTEYWLQDFEDLRIPLWMANINYAPRLNSNLQLLIIPDFEQSTAAYPTAPYVFYSTSRFENWRLAQNEVNMNIHYPAKRFENSTFAMQWSDKIGDMDYTLNYLSGYYYSVRNYTILVSFPLKRWKVERSFKRWKMYGASFNKTLTNQGPLQGTTFRGDFAFYDDEPMYWGNPETAASSGIKRLDNIFWLIGIDKYVVTNWLVSFQFAQYTLQNSKPGATTSAANYYFNPYTYGPQDPQENIFSLKISTDFMNERVKPEILWSLTDDNQGRVSPKVTYELKDNLFLTLGIHYFYGHLFDSNGQFRDQNQVYGNLKLTF